METHVNKVNTNLTLPIFTERHKGPLVDDFTAFIFYVVFYVTISGIVGILGTVANIINMAIFFRQGLFSSSSNLNLFSLAVADFGVSFTTFVHSICSAVLVIDIPVLSWDFFSVVYLTISWPNTIFSLTNRLLTAYVALERFACVVLPFRVKTLFTPPRSLIYITLMFTYSILSIVPIYVTSKLDFVVQDGTNTSLLTLVTTEDRDVVHNIYYVMNFIVLSTSTVLVVLICTVTTTSRLKTSLEWRKGANGVAVTADSTPTVQENQQTNDAMNKSENNGELKNKKTAHELKLVKMITSISIIYLISFIPTLGLFILKFLDDRFGTSKQYYNLPHIIYSIIFASGVCNCSVNICVYFRMSTRYRQEFRKLFGMGDTEKLQ